MYVGGLAIVNVRRDAAIPAAEKVPKTEADEHGADDGFQPQSQAWGNGHSACDNKRADKEDRQRMP